MTIHATPTRRRILADVAEGNVYRAGDSHDYDGMEYRRDAAMAAMQRAGWVELGEADPRTPHKRPWRLTEAGRAVLEQGRGAAT